MSLCFVIAVDLIPPSPERSLLVPEAQLFYDLQVVLMASGTDSLGFGPCHVGLLDVLIFKVDDGGLHFLDLDDFAALLALSSVLAPLKEG